MHVTVRADGGPEIGYGHLVRTSALASELLDDGHEVTYATTTPTYVEEVCPNEVGIAELPSRDEPTRLLEWLDNVDADVTVIDSYLADCDYQQAVRDQLPTMLVSDDTRHPVCADVVVNGNLYAPELDYDVRGTEPTWCLGPEYVLLREEITQLADETPPWRSRLERAIVTMGGSDIANATPNAIRAFDGTSLRVDIVVGPGFSNEAEIRDVAADVSADARVVRDPPDLPRLMFQADFAVGACGSTTYELLALGAPIVCSPVVENQERIAAALSRRDVATVVDEADREQGFRRGVTRYLEDRDLRRERRDRGRSIVDGHGTERVCAELLSTIDENAVS